MKVKTDKEVEAVFKAYPDFVKTKMLELRALILEAADELEEVSAIEETLKWGEPSYLTKYGSTVRIDWKAKKTDHYAVYFKCTSKLVPTFRMLYPKLFEFEKNRAIVFSIEDELPNDALKSCIKAALRYHKIKHLPALGM